VCPESVDEAPSLPGKSMIADANPFFHIGTVLVALYEEPDKPTNAMSSIVQLLGGPSPDEYNALLAERDELLERVRRAEEELAQIKASSYSPVPMYSEQAPISTPACIFEVKP